MADEKLRESQPATRQDSIPGGASDWASQFVKHFELNFSDASRSLLPESPLSDLHHATIRAVLHTLLDAGMDAEAVEESIGQALIERRLGRSEWNSELNRRRFELIDKEIQETLTLADSILSMLAAAAIPSSRINPLAIRSIYCIRRQSQRKPTDRFFREIPQHGVCSGNST